MAAATAMVRMVRAEAEGALRPGPVLAWGRWERMRRGRHRECLGVQKLVAGVEINLVALLMYVISSPDFETSAGAAEGPDWLITRTTVQFKARTASNKPRRRQS